MTIKDSGMRQEFDTGAVRDITEGKGRCDLLPLGTIGLHFHDEILLNIGGFMTTGDSCLLVGAVKIFSIRSKIDTFTAFLEVSKHYEDGCRKYGERNWEKGIPLHCFIDSAVRHYLKFLRGDDDEPHDRAFLWNILGALWTLDNKPELNDLPFAEKE